MGGTSVRKSEGKRPLGRQRGG